MNLFYSNYFFHCSVIVDLAVVVVLLLVTPTGCVVFTGHHVQCTLWVSLQRAFTCIIVQKPFFNSISQASARQPSPSRLTCLMFCREQNESFILHSFPLPLLLFLSINNTNMCERTKEGDGQKHKTIRSLAPNLSHVGETSNWEILVPKTVTPTTLSLHPDELETIWKSPFYEFPSIRTPLFFIQCSVI